MSNIVEQINDAITSQIGTSLGSTYNELDHIHEVGKNNFLRNTKRYGVRPLDANPGIAVTKHYSLDHSFEIILTHDYLNNGVNDVDQRDKTFILYDATDDIYKDLFNTKAGIPSIIFNIRALSISEPEFLATSKVVVLRSQITVLYRQLLS